ncbi:MAG: hypothetical protein J0H54_13510 [Rhizobiales bacterium]|nr:hypothetical protein [Hyphomicrobiales bacterium]
MSAMQRAQTETQAANGALRHLGVPGIADLATGMDHASREARVAFGGARDECLREADYNFAAAWISPAAAAEQAIGPLKIRYPLPADCIKVRFVQDLDEDEWAVETAKVTIGGIPVDTLVLVTNSSAPLICITRRIEDVRLWDPLFLAAFELRLAAKLAAPLSKELGAGASLDQRAAEKAERATRVDGREKAPSTISRQTSWVTARR